MPDRQDLQRSMNTKIAPSIPGRAWDSTVAVVVADRPHVRQIGTAVLFQIADVFFVVTAAHVVQSACDANRALGISGGVDDYFVALSGHWVRSTGKGGDPADPYDVAVHRLSEDAVRRLSGARFLRLSEVDFGDPGPRAVCTLFGFPGVWSVPTSADAQPLVAKPLEFTTYTYDGAIGGLQQYEPRLHMLLSATAEDLTSPDGAPLNFQDRIGQSVRLPIGLRGISGCSVWHIGDLDVPIQLWPDRDATLVGMVSGVYQAHGAVKVTRWVAVTTLINAAFPDLQPVLRLHLGW